jgi:hypothetical protein
MDSMRLCGYTTAGVHYVGIKMFNHLPTHIKSVANEIQVFKNNLKRSSRSLILSYR